VPEEVSEKVRELAARTFTALGAEGFGRVDFFWDEAAGQVYVNEMNTIPGFTAFSMYPLLWGAAGLPYRELIDRIVRHGIERYNAKNHR
jgi:D-alanine-D-alanine ligase